MHKSMPGPNTMLPVLDLSGPPDLDHIISYKKREAIFKQQVSELHRQWCLCGSAKNHYVKNSEPLTNSSCGGGGDEADSSKKDAATGTEDMDVTDEEIIAIGSDV
nr:ORF2 [Torque teno felis virus]